MSWANRMTKDLLLTTKGKGNNFLKVATITSCRLAKLLQPTDAHK